MQYLTINDIIQIYWSLPQWDGVNWITIDKSGRINGFNTKPKLNKFYGIWGGNVNHIGGKIHPSKIIFWESLIFERPPEFMDFETAIGKLWDKLPLSIKKIKIDTMGYIHSPNEDISFELNCSFDCKLKFKRPIVSEYRTSTQLISLFKKLQDYLDNTPREKITKDWELVKSRGLTGSPTAEEYIKTFK